MERIPLAEDLLECRDLIRSWIHRTPLLSNRSLNTISGAHLWFKCENFQKVGAFKFRGASNALASSSAELVENGVATHSSGNHAQAVALAARIKGVPAYIVMPRNAPEVKKAAVKGYGAEVIFCEPTLEARESTLAEVVKRTGAHIVHPYDDYRIITGQATAAMEILETLEDLDILMAPVGGGGLLSGTALAAHYFRPGLQVIAAEPKGADDACRSFKAGKLIPSKNPQTIADGLLTSLGQRNFPIIQQHVNEILTVEEESIVQAMRLIWERMKIIIEPSCAVPLAAILENREKFQGKKIAMILTGGNVDLEKLPF